jgi:hypothetical protein
MNDRDHPPPAPPPDGAAPTHAADASKVDPSPVRLPRPAIEEEEMGGEAPCQLHNFWDVPE